MNDKEKKEYYRNEIRRMLDEYDDLNADKYFCGFIKKKLEIIKAGK